MNGHEGIGIVNLWTLGKYLCMYIAFSNFQFFNARFSVLLVFSVIYVYKYVQEYRVYTLY